MRRGDPAAGLGQIWWHPTRESRMLILSAPHECASGTFVYARRIGARGARQAPGVRRLDGKVLQPPVDVDGRLADATFESSVPLLRCRGMMYARELAYLLRPTGLPDAYGVGEMLLPGADMDLVVLRERASSPVLEEYAEAAELAQWRTAVRRLGRG